jgi:ligand-binding SRPBCC domain-containing protein
MQYELKREQFIPISVEQAWDFFSSPKNLAVITPDEMGFIIKSDVPEKMFSGLLIDYTVKPLLGIPLRWQTEILEVDEYKSFVDNQNKGPYKLWHHTHLFEPVNGGVKMTDIVKYELPLGVLGTIAHAAFVKNKLNHIFDYRFKKVEEIFGKYVDVNQTAAQSI